jgi:hypothetical protein
MEMDMQKRNQSKFKSWFAALIPIVMLGCATTYKADPNLNSKYSPPPPPAADQTSIYIIRGSNFVGGARSVWVAVNDKAVAALSNGSHVLLRVKSGVNTVNIVQNLAGLAFVPIDNRPGETVFLSLDYVHGGLREVSKDLGISMVMNTKAMEPLADARPNTGYDDGILNPGFLGFPIMKAGGEKIEPDANSAVITFVRPGTLAKNTPFSIWSETDFVGNIKGDSFFQARVTPGHHVFIARAEHYAVLNADVAPGKNYFVQFEVNYGWNEGHVKILPLDPKAINDPKIKPSLDSSKLYTVDKKVLESAVVKTRIDAGNKYLTDARRKISGGQLPSRQLTADQGI